MAKRNRERLRLEKQEAKREKQAARQAEAENRPEVDETALMEEFAQLSERHANEEITEAEYLEERRRIFAGLGLETD